MTEEQKTGNEWGQGTASINRRMLHMLAVFAHHCPVSEQDRSDRDQAVAAAQESLYPTPAAASGSEQEDAK